MATGACGINCSVCRLHKLAKCGSCGPATGELAALKVRVQEQLLGSPCPLLACARLNRVDHCLSDCDQFPCENFNSGPYPFSTGFLSMQKRRREEIMQYNESQKGYQIPPEHWQTILSRDPQLLQILCIPGSTAEEWLTIRLLNRQIRINPRGEQIEELVKVSGNDLWKPANVLTAQAAIFYLVQGEQVCMSGTWLPEHQLKCGSFFRGIHQLPVGPLLERYDHKPHKFIHRAEQLGGKTVREMGDAAVQIWLLDQAPVKLILWCSDDELPASLTVLFDSSIEEILAADAIWALFQLLVERMLEEE